MSFDNVIAGDYGNPHTVVMKKESDGSAQNVSAFTTSQVLQYRSPDNVTATKTGEFTTDGSDGKVTYTPIDGDIPEDAGGGKWKVRARVKSGSAQLTSRWIEFTVQDGS